MLSIYFYSKKNLITPLIALVIQELICKTVADLELIEREASASITLGSVFAIMLGGTTSIPTGSVYISDSPPSLCSDLSIQFLMLWWTTPQP